MNPASSPLVFLPTFSGRTFGDKQQRRPSWYSATASCQSIEWNSSHWLWPVTIHWPHLFFVHHRIPYVRVAGPFMLALRTPLSWLCICEFIMRFSMCTPSFTGGVQTTYPTSWGLSTAVVHAPAYDLLQQRTSRRRGYGQNVESAPFLTLALLRGTLYRRTCVLFLTLCFLGSDWRLTFLVLLLTFVDYCCLCYVMLCNPYVNDSFNAPMFSV